jgi:hypothetical protein
MNFWVDHVAKFENRLNSHIIHRIVGSEIPGAENGIALPNFEFSMHLNLYNKALYQNPEV